MIELLMSGNRFIETKATSGLIFGTDDEVEWYQSMYIPEDAQQILNTWPRVQAATYYPNADSAPTGSVSNWYYDVERDSFVQPDNSDPVQSILSPTKLTQYTMESVLTSKNADDDLIGMVVAADVIDGEYMALYATIHAGGFGGPIVSFRFSDSSATSIVPASSVVIGNNSIASHANSGGGTGWSGRSVRIRVSRNGNMVSMRCSDWNSTTLLEGSELILNLNDLPRNGYKLNSPARYGFCTQSQADSTYLNYSIQSSEISDGTKMYSAESNKKWIFSNGTWNLSLDTATDDFEGFDRVVNNDTGNIYQLKDGEFSYLRTTGIIESSSPTTVVMEVNDVYVINKEELNMFLVYDEELSVVGLFDIDGVDVDISGDDVTISTDDIGGGFVVYVKSSDNIDPNTNINSRVIGFFDVLVELK